MLKIKAGESEARQILTHIPAGTYTVTEKDSNWRYTLSTSSETQIDFVHNSSLTGRALSLTLNPAEMNTFTFLFKNDLSNSSWVDYNTSITNKMKKVD